MRFENRKLTVKVDVDDPRGWRPCFEVEGVRLPTGFFFGISAATGDLVDNHDVIGVKTYELPITSSVGSDVEGEEEEDPASIVPRAEFYESPRARKDDDEGGLSGVAIFFIVLVVLIAVVVVGVVIVVCLDSSNSMSTGPGRKRFY